MTKEQETLQEWISASDNIVFFGGAGVSTESGIPDFRSVDGLYHQQFQYPPETMLSHSFYASHTEEFFDFYRKKLLALWAKPNMAHLHQMAGSREVLELHGSVHRNYCQACGRFYPVEAVAEAEGVPRCACGGVIKPDVVLYEEALDGTVMRRALDYIRKADMLIIGGTSLVVYPAAGLVNDYRGNKLTLINKGVTSMDWQADLVVSGPIGEILGAVQI